MIDAAYKNIRLAAGHMLQGQFHTIHRRAAALHPPQSLLLGPHGLQPYRSHRRNGTCHAAAGPVGCHHSHIAQSTHQAREFLYALCKDSIIIGDEN